MSDVQDITPTEADALVFIETPAPEPTPEQIADQAAEASANRVLSVSSTLHAMVSQYRELVALDDDERARAVAALVTLLEG
jgi:hypothetical protein